MSARIIIRETDTGYVSEVWQVSGFHDGLHRWESDEDLALFLGSIDARATPQISLPGDDPADQSSWVDLDDAIDYFEAQPCMFENCPNLADKPEEFCVFHLEQMAGPGATPSAEPA